jgi:hypothetical protein
MGRRLTLVLVCAATLSAAGCGGGGEHEEDDAEVNFEGHSTTGQVKLEVECTDRTSVGLTIRPE